MSGLLIRRQTPRALALASIALLPLLSGCNDFQDARGRERDVQRTVDQAHLPTTPMVSIEDQPYLLGDILRDVDTTPAILKEPASILIARPVTLRDAAIQASRVTHVPVSVTPDAEVEESLGAPSTSGFNGSSLPPPPSVTGGMSAAQTTPRAITGATWHGSGPWLQYSGTREGIFDAIATRFGVWKKFEDGHVTFFRQETKTFPVPAFAGVMKSSSSIAAVTGGGGSSSGGSGGSMGGGSSGGMSSGGTGGSSGSGRSSGRTSIARQSSVDRWKTIEKTASAISGGGTVVADEGLGTLTVTGNPDQVERVRDWMRGLSESLMQQVAIDVHVYTVKLNKETNYGWSPQVAVQNYGKVYGLSSVAAAVPSLNASETPFSFGASILDTAKGAAGQFSGSQLAVQALSEIGNVTEVYSRSAVATNGMSAPFQNGINTTYLAQSSSVLASNAGASSTLSPGVVMSGFMGDVTPRIIDQRIMLHISFLLQTLLSITTFSSNSSTIQEPKTSSTSLDDTVVLRSGSTLMLSGYVDDASSRDRTGVGHPMNWLLGGGGDATLNKTQIIVTVEAHTL